MRLLRGGSSATALAPPPEPEPDPEPDPISVGFAWVGAVTDDAATVKLRSTDAVTVTLLVSEQSDLDDPTEVEATEGSDEMWTATVSGLSADTLYYFGFAGSDLTGTFRTFGATDFVIAAGSCAGHTNQAQYVTGAARTSDSPAFERIEDRDPALFIHLGDIHYKDISTNSPSSFRSAYRDVLANARQHSLYRHVPMAYVWDDHDYGANNSNGASASRPAAQSVYREYVPHYPLPADSRLGGDGEIYQSFPIGRVRVILLDNRSERSSQSATDNSSKTILGTDQKAWLKAELLAATEPCIVLAVCAPWIMALSDNWGNYGTERQELAEFFEDNDLTSRLIILHGDKHALMADDGTNSQFDPDAVTDGPKLVCFAPLDGGPTTSDGTHSTPPTVDRRQQYGTLSFADSGTEIVVTAQGWEVNNTIETEAFNLEWTFPG